MNVCGWDKWQTYRKDRGTPPWIKVHRNLMTNPEWVSLDDAEKGQLVSIWMLAADKGGQIPDDSRLIQRMAMLENAPDLEKFCKLGFITDEECSPQGSDDGEEEGKVYFIQQQEAVKIGFSKNPWARLAQLKVGMPYVATLLFHVVATKSQEQATHELFKKHRLQGEWFSICPEILAYIRNCEETGELLTSYPQMVAGLPDAPETEAETETETETDKPLVPSKKAPAKESYSELFESFWMAYPGNRRGNKKNAFREWKKIPDEHRLHLSIIVERRKLNDLDWRREKFKYVPHAERYLKGERWLDEWQVEQPQYSDVTANNIQTLKNWIPK